MKKRFELSREPLGANCVLVEWKSSSSKIQEVEGYSSCLLKLISKFREK